MKNLKNIAITAGLYFIFGLFSLLIAMPPGYASPLWAPSGIALAFMLVFGYNVWPGIIVGSFGVNFIISLLNPQDLAFADIIFLTAGLSAADIAQAFFATFLVKRYAVVPVTLRNIRNIFNFFILGGVVGGLVAPTLKVCFLFYSNIIFIENMLLSWGVMWAGQLIGVVLFAPLVLAWIGLPRTSWQSRKYSLTTWILFMSLVFFSVFYFGWKLEQAQLKNEFNNEINIFSKSVEHKLQEFRLISNSIQAFYGSSSFVDRNEFKKYIQKISADFIDIVSVSWVPRVKSEEVDQYIKQALNDGIDNYHIKDIAEDGSLQPAIWRDVYYPIFYIEPQEANKIALGINNGSELHRFEATQKAMDRNDIIVSAPIILGQDKKHNIRSFVMVSPIYINESSIEFIEQRRENIHGFVTVTARLNNFIAYALRKSSFSHTLQVNIFDVEYSAYDYIYNHKNVVLDEDIFELTESRIINFSGRSWRMDFQPTSEFYANHRTLSMWFLLLAVALMAPLLCALILFITGQTLEVEYLVDEKTKELEKEVVLKEKVALELAEQTKMLTYQKEAMLNILEDAEDARGAVEESRKETQMILDNVSAYIFYKDGNNKILRLNQTAANAMGKKIEEVEGHQTEEFYDPEVAAKYLKDDLEVVTSKAPKLNIIEQWKLKDGEERWMSTDKVPLLDKNGVLNRILVVATDITEQKQARQDLEMVQQRHKLATQAAEVGVWEYNLISNELIWDDVMFKLYNIPSDNMSLTYQSWIDSFYPEDKEEFEQSLQKSIKSGVDFDTEFRIVWPNGDIRSIKSFAIIERDSEGRALKMVGTNWDITQEKIMQRQVEESAEAKERFTSIVSHELRTPLTAIKEGINIVVDQTLGELNPKQLKFLELSKRNVDRLSHLINDVLDYQKIQAGKMAFYLEENNMNRAIQETIEVMQPHAKLKGLELKVDLDEMLPVFPFDYSKIMQVLTNIINNAIKFTDEGSVTVKSERNDNMVYVSIVDTGQGISQQDLPKLFQSFEQFGGNDRKVGGTGLGLAICKELITRHGGKIWAESEVGKGTTFKIALPIRDRRA